MAGSRPTRRVSKEREYTRGIPGCLTVLDVTPVTHGVRGDIGADKMYRLLILKHTGCVCVYDESDRLPSVAFNPTADDETAETFRPFLRKDYPSQNNVG